MHDMDRWQAVVNTVMNFTFYGPCFVIYIYIREEDQLE